MTGAPPAVLVAFDTASTPDRISGAAHISASRVTSRRWALLPSPSTPDHTRFAVSLNGNTIGELGVRCRIAGARWSALVEVSGDMSDPEVSSGVGAFATAFADVVRATDPSLRQIAGTPSSSHPLPPPPPPPPLRRRRLLRPLRLHSDCPRSRRRLLHRRLPNRMSRRPSQRYRRHLHRRHRRPPRHSHSIR